MKSDELLNKANELLNESDIQRIKEEYGIDVNKKIYIEPLNLQFILIPDKDFIKEIKKAGKWKYAFIISVAWFTCMVGLIMSSILVIPSLIIPLFIRKKKKTKIKKCQTYI